MIHIFEQGTSNKTFILLHGTGGDEKNLIPIAKYIDNHASILGIRGNVNEDGMNRYFKRFGMNKYDLESLNIETENLIEFIYKAIKQYKLEDSEIYILGFSNGANIAISMLKHELNYSFIFILLSPALVEPNSKLYNLSQTKVFISTSPMDPYLPNHEFKILNQKFIDSSAQVTIYQHPYGHRVTSEVLNEIKNWLNG